MAKNPMQRKAQNSFLLGVLVTLLITGIIIGILIVLLTNLTKEKKEEEASLKSIYVLAHDVKSGDTITVDDLEVKNANISLVPSNYLTLTDLNNKTDVIDATSGNLIKKYNVVSKIDLKKGTIITSDMIKVDGEVTNDIRKMEYNVIQLPSQIQSGSYIDVRLRLANGKDLIVLSHKKVEIPVVNGVESESTIWMNLSENEILTLSCAIVETYKMEDALLYATEYVEPGLQEAATETYYPSHEIVLLIYNNPNCVDEAKLELKDRLDLQSNGNIGDKASYTYNSVRNSISNSTTNNDISGKVTDEIQNMKEERKKYLESLRILN